MPFVTKKHPACLMSAPLPNTSTPVEAYPDPVLTVCFRTDDINHCLTMPVILFIFFAVVRAVGVAL